MDIYRFLLKQKLRLFASYQHKDFAIVRLRPAVGLL